MKVLGIDSSGLVASVAGVEDDILLAEYTVNYKKTHSQTLLPMLKEIGDMINLDLNSLDAIAIAAGPGSFTGLRIGSATAKGLGLALDKPIIPVPTVDGLAYDLWGTDKIVCPIMDARRNQVFNAVYSVSKGKLTKEVHDRSILIKDLYEELKDVEENIYFVGDGQDKVLDYFSENDMLKENFKFPEYLENVQRGTNTAMIAYNNQSGKKKGKDILPQYLKLTQAEQELRKKREK